MQSNLFVKRISSFSNSQRTQFKSICSKIIKSWSPKLSQIPEHKSILALVHYLHPHIQTDDQNVSWPQTEWPRQTVTLLSFGRGFRLSIRLGFRLEDGWSCGHSGVGLLSLWSFSVAILRFKNMWPIFAWVNIRFGLTTRSLLFFFVFLSIQLWQRSVLSKPNFSKRKRISSKFTSQRCS